MKSSKIAGNWRMQCGQEHALIYAKDSGNFEYTGDDDDEVFVCEIQVLIARIT